MSDTTNREPLAPAGCSANPHPTGKHVARVLEFHRNGAVWIQAKCVACGLQWKERYRFDFAYETMTPNNQGEPQPPTTGVADIKNV